MSPIEAVVKEFEIESANTRKALERVPADRFGWSPHEKSWTFGKLASHLAEIPIWAGTIIDTEELVMGEEEYKPFEAASPRELLEAFDRNVAEAVQRMRTAAPDVWGGNWRIRAGDKVMWEAPRLVVTKTFLINHAIQHRGQMEVYMRLNDVPVPSIYGPSADEGGM